MFGNKMKLSSQQKKEIEESVKIILEDFERKLEKKTEAYLTKVQGFCREIAKEEVEKAADKLLEFKKTVK